MGAMLTGRRGDREHANVAIIMLSQSG